MRIALDFDEVLFPMIDKLNAFYSRKTRTSISKHPKRYNYASHFKITPHSAKCLVRDFYRSDEHMNAQPLHSVDILSKLKRKHSLGIITGRQNYSRQQTYTFLDTFYPNIFDYIEFTNSYSLYGDEIPKFVVCNNRNVDLIIDDSINVCDSALKHGFSSILYGTYEWNKDNDTLLRINSLNNLNDILC